MNRLEQLIQELCPEGVEYKLLKDCVQKVRNIKWSETRGKSFQYIDLTSVDRVTHRITETQTIDENNAPSRAQQIVQTEDILLGSTRPLLKRYCLIGDSYDGHICSTGFCVLRADEKIALKKWIYYQVASSAFFEHIEKFQKGTSYPAISDADVKSYRIPIPPLPIQTEIVRILDGFSECTAQLTANLEKEFTVRKKQIEYYRELLLSFEDASPSIVEYRKLGDVAQYAKKRTEAAQVNESTYVGVENLLPNKQGKIKSSYVPQTGVVIVFEKGDILIGNIRPYLRKIWLADCEGGTNGDVLAIQINRKENITPGFLYYVLSSERFFLYDIENSKGAKMPRGDKKAVLEYRIPIPSPTEQARIVSILDRFDALCNDLTSGLPAEIEARRKQYDYYRDKLLSFKEKRA